MVGAVALALMVASVVAYVITDVFEQIKYNKEIEENE